MPDTGALPSNLLKVYSDAIEPFITNCVNLLSTGKTAKPLLKLKEML